MKFLFIVTMTAEPMYTESKERMEPARHSMCPDYQLLESAVKICFVFVLNLFHEEQCNEVHLQSSQSLWKLQLMHALTINCWEANCYSILFQVCSTRYTYSVTNEERYD